MKMSEIQIVVHPSEDKIDALKAFLKALKIKFEVVKKKPYDEEFVKIIQKGDDDIKKGKGKKITLEELDDLWK
jgi:arsenate reductase-like glutaredoxin family protein